MKIIFGLGNPGKKYERTRHNLGWRVIDQLANSFITPGIAKLKKKFESACLTIASPESNLSLTGETIMLVKPLTYMNNSGQAVKHILNYHPEPLTNILVICDDFQLPLGKIRIRPKGSAGGHNGLASIIQSLNTDNFPRLRVGLASPTAPIISGQTDFEPADYVLSNFTRAEEQSLKKTMPDITGAVHCWINDGVEKCMNRFN
ncbi:MAG: aminoacyl-tRNA hydrolase [Planctomycetota bacterium]